MSTTAVPTPYIDATGFNNVTFADVLAGVTTDYQSIYGQDVVLSEDTQDGMWLSAQAAAYVDACNLALATYNSFRPSQAQGTGLDSVVKVNGIARKVPTTSTVDLTCVGTVGVTVTNGTATDNATANTWLLPTFTFPSSGLIVVTALCAVQGAVVAPPGTVTVIGTPTQGWNSVVNETAAQAGLAVELDPALRQRQTLSTELPSRGILAGIVGNVLALPGVADVTPYENTGNLPDANGLPGHSICLVVNGGDATAIATTIAEARPCCGTYGSTQIPVTDAYGLTQTYSFQRKTAVPLSISVGVKPMAGFTAAIQNLIVQSLLVYVNSLPTGQTVYLSRLYLPANLSGPAALAAVAQIVPPSTNDALNALLLSYAQTFEITYIYVSRGGTPPASADVPMAFAEFPTLTTSGIQTVTVTS